MKFLYKAKYTPIGDFWTRILFWVLLISGFNILESNNNLPVGISEALEVQHEGRAVEVNDSFSSICLLDQNLLNINCKFLDDSFIDIRKVKFSKNPY
jgi:hypothetical protein